MALCLRCAAAAAALALTGLPAHAEGPYVLLELGQGQIDIDSPEAIPFTSMTATDDNATSAAVGGGYLFPSGVYVDLAYTAIDTVSIFGLADRLDLTSFKFGAGYTIEAGESFNFLVKAGFAFWDLEARESPFFNPGPEQTLKSDGTDLFWEIGAEYEINDSFRISLVHARETNDLGDASATRLGIKYYFRTR